MRKTYRIGVVLIITADTKNEPNFEEIVHLLSQVDKGTAQAFVKVVNCSDDNADAVKIADELKLDS